MAQKVKSKGTTLQQQIGTLYLPVAQLISLDLPDMESETYDSDTLDNELAGIPYEPTGRTEGGSLGFEGFYDPALVDHQELLALLTTPSSEEWRLVFADNVDPEECSQWSFSSAGISFGGAVALGEGVKMSGSIKLDGLPSFPS